MPAGGAPGAAASTTASHTHTHTHTHTHNTHTHNTHTHRRFRPMKGTISGREERTLMKLLVDVNSDRVVGCHM